MDWAEGFYSRTGQWWGPAESGVGERDYRRLATMERLCGRSPMRILDLGSSYGNTAAVMAQAGHDVVGIEISDRIDFARRYEQQAGAGSLRFVRGDFSQATFDEPFDVVCYWNGFGVGTDADQRWLLGRIADAWLAPAGAALIDVANPACWIKAVGAKEPLAADAAEGYDYDVSEHVDFDPVRSRMIDTWWQTETPDDRWSQAIRCYAPADFALLLEGTGLRLDLMELDGEELEPQQAYTSAHPMWTRHEYLVKLTKAAAER